MSQSFSRELARFGPTSNHPPVSRAAARRYCSQLALRHYENFTVASVLLPRHLIRHFHHIYAYCRWADDLADEAGGGKYALDLLRWWRQSLLDVYAGKPSRHPVFIALRETIAQFAIPPQPFLDLLFAFEQDQLVKRYPTFDKLLEYCRYSANPVGHLVLYLCGAYTPENAALADPICTALQLANFWQDVARDFDMDRVYLPEEDRLRFGYREADLHERRFNASFAALMRFEVERTKDLFYRGRPLIERMPPDFRIDIELFWRGGLAILHKIEQIEFNVWDTRPTLSKWEKGKLLAGAVWQRLQASLPW